MNAQIIDNSEFIDAETMTTKERFTFQDIIINHLRKISELCSQEFSPGRWEDKPVLVAGSLTTTKVYLPDGRAGYINAVSYLYDLLLPKFDDDMNKKDLEIKTKLQLEKDKAIKERMKKEDWLDIEVKISRTLFQELNLLLSRIKFFEANRISE